MSEYDYFLDECFENGIDPESVDFYAWRGTTRQRLEDEASERDFQYAREN